MVVRHPQCDIVLECPHVAAVQAKAYLHQNDVSHLGCATCVAPPDLVCMCGFIAQVWISDLGPSTAEPILTLVNGDKLDAEPRQLQPDDVIEILGRRFRYGALSSTEALRNMQRPHPQDISFHSDSHKQGTVGSHPARR